MVHTCLEILPKTDSGGPRQVAVLLLVACWAVPFLYGLGDTYLWQDEAQTALLGQAVLRYGLPYVGSGPESASALAGRDRGWAGLFVHLPPLQAYVAALGMLVGGQTSWGARWLFASCGLMTCVALAWALRPVGNLRIQGMAAAALALHVPFLLHARQARYYAPAALLVALLFGLYLRILVASPSEWAFKRNRSAKLAAMFQQPLFCGTGIALSALAWTFEISAATCLGAGAVLALCLLARALLQQRGHLDELFAFLGALMVGLASLLAWEAMAWTAPSHRMGIGFNDRFPEWPWYFLGQLNAYGAPWMLTLLPLAVGVLLRIRGPARGAPDELLVAAALSISMVLLHAVVATATTHRFFRYVFPAVPLLVAAYVTSWEYVSQRLPWPALSRSLALLAWVVLVSGIGTGRAASGQAWWPWERWLEEETGVRWSRRPEVNLQHFVRELRSPNPGPVAAVVEFLKHHARPQESLVAEYEEKALKFHTALRVYGGETGEFPPGPPQWIWPRHFPSLWWETKLTRAWIEKSIRWEDYEAITLENVPDTLWENRPCPDVHFFTFEDRRAFTERVVVLYRRKALDEATSP
jgi:hypothetical protein